MKVFNVLRNVLFVAAIIIIISAGACFAFRIQPVVVMSGSMEPEIHTGAVAFVRKGAEVKVGDAVAFYRGEMYVTHRIIEETPDGYVTKGDANATEDPSKVRPEDVVGKVIFSIPKLGVIFKFLSSKAGLILSGAVILCLILSMFIVQVNDNQEEKGERKMNLFSKKKNSPAVDIGSAASVKERPVTADTIQIQPQAAAAEASAPEENLFLAALEKSNMEFEQANNKEQSQPAQSSEDLFLAALEKQMGGAQEVIAEPKNEYKEKYEELLKKSKALNAKYIEAMENTAKLNKKHEDLKGRFLALMTFMLKKNLITEEFFMNEKIKLN